MKNPLINRKIVGNDMALNKVRRKEEFEKVHLPGGNEKKQMVNNPHG